MFKKCALVLTALLALGGFASTAQAATMTITYAIDGTVGLPALGLFVIAPVTGSMAIQYTATGGVASGSAGTPLHGPARIVSGNVAGPVSFVLGGDQFTGVANGNFAPAPPGSLMSSGILNLPVLGLISGNVHCSGLSCTGFGFTPSVVAPLSIPLSGGLAGTAATTGSFLFGSFGLGGAIGLAFTAAIPGGIPLTATLNLTEVSRHFVPEPGSLSLVGLGLVGLVGVAQRARARRRS
jgi:hypothetical protein